MIVPRAPLRSAPALGTLASALGAPALGCLALSASLLTACSGSTVDPRAAATSAPESAAGAGESPSGAGASEAAARLPDGAAAGLVCAAPSFDFGTIWEGEAVEHTFELAAAGDGPVRVEAVRATCGCTLARLERGDGAPFAEGETLEPGERLELHVRFSSLHRVGEHDRPITLYGNVSPSGRFQVSLVGEVRPRLQAAEEVADFGKLLRDDSGSAAIELSTADGQPVRLLPPRPPGPFEVASWPADLAVDLAPVDPDARGRAERWTATLDLASGGEAGAFHWPVRIEIADADGEYSGTGATVYARWQRVRPVEASPPTLALGVLRRGVLASTSVELVANAADVDLAALDADGASISAQVQGRDVSEHLSLVLRGGDETGRAVLELVVDGLPGDLVGPLRGQAVLEVGHGDQESLTIWIDGIISTR